MFTFAELAHMVDATQLRSRGHMLDASALMGCLGWGGVGMFTFAELAHMVDAHMVDLLQRCLPAKNTATIYTDGNTAWKNEWNRLRLKHKSVSHSKMQFVVRDQKPLKGQARLKGTQVADRLWQALKKYLPSEISTKDRLLVGSTHVS